MILKGSATDRFFRQVDPRIDAVLLYGPDGGLIRERAEALCRLIAGRLDDPFRVVELTGSMLRDDPARLADEAAAISMTGGRRVVRVRQPTDADAAMFAQILERPIGSSMIIVEAGDLPSRSKLRSQFEAAERGVAIPCYADSDESLGALITSVLDEAGLGVTAEACEYLIAHLGADRAVTRRELEKLVLYVGPGGRRVELDDAEACVGDSAALSIENAVLAAADGDRAGLSRALARVFAAGETPVGLLRAAQRHFQRLHLVAGQVANGQSIERAAAALRPKLFWKIESRFRAEARLWPVAGLASALDRLTAAEVACKATGSPDELLASRCLMELAGYAERLRARG